MSALGPSGSNTHPGFNLSQASLRRNAAFPPPHGSQGSKQSPAPHTASPYQPQAYAPQQPHQGAYPQHLFTQPQVNGNVPNGSSRNPNSHVPNALGVPRQRGLPPRQQMPQPNPPPMLFHGPMSQSVQHDPILSHQQQQHQQQQHQQHQQQQHQQQQHQQQQQHPQQQPQPQHQHQQQQHPHHPQQHQQQQQQQQQPPPQHQPHPSHQQHPGHPGHQSHPQHQTHPSQPALPAHQQHPQHQHQQQHPQHSQHPQHPQHQSHTPHQHHQQVPQPPQQQQHTPQQQHQPHPQHNQQQAPPQPPAQQQAPPQQPTPQQQQQQQQQQRTPQQSHQQPTPPQPSSAKQSSQTKAQGQPQVTQPRQGTPRQAAEAAAQPQQEQQHGADEMDVDGNQEGVEDAGGLDSKLMNDPSYVPTQPMGEMMSPPPEGGSYPTLEAVQKAVLRYCTSVGYAIVIGRSKKTVPGLKKVLFVCDRAGKPPSRVSPEFRKRKTSSRKCDCPFGFFAIEQRTQWTIRYRPDPTHLRHNHGPSEGPSNHPAARKLDSKMVAAVKELKENGAGVSETLQILQTENPDCHLLPRDIYNARAAINRNPQKVATGLAEDQPTIYTKPPNSVEDRIRAELRRELAKARDDLKKVEEEKQKEIDALTAKLKEKDQLIEKFETFIDICNQRVMVQRERLSGPGRSPAAGSNPA